MTTPTPPCVRCGTLGGLAWRGQRAGVDPRRADGTAYGVPGPLCYHCFDWAKSQPTAAPCGDCQTIHGGIRYGQRRPTRINGDPYGFDGVLCLDCAERARWRRQKRREQARVQRIRVGRSRAAHPASVPSVAEQDEIRARAAMVREAKERKLRAGRATALTNDELDRVLPTERPMNAAIPPLHPSSARSPGVSRGHSRCSSAQESPR